MQSPGRYTDVTVDGMWRYCLQQVENVQMENQCHPFTVLDGNATTPPEVVPPDDMKFQQFAKARGALNLLTCLDTGFRDGVVSGRVQGNNLLNGDFPALMQADGELLADVGRFFCHARLHTHVLALAEQPGARSLGDTNM